MGQRVVERERERERDREIRRERGEQSKHGILEMKFTPSSVVRRQEREREQAKEHKQRASCRNRRGISDLRLEKPWKTAQLWNNWIRLKTQNR